MSRLPDFLYQEPPPGYVAGIGRGASGFTTRQDVGAARLPPPQRLKEVAGEDENDEGRFADAEGNGDDAGLLMADEVDEEDEEADRIYGAIDERLRSRNKKRRVRSEDEDSTEDNGLDELAVISKQFVDLKKHLSSVSEDQWAALPEVGDLTKRNKRLKKEMNANRKEYAAPDSLISGLSASGDDASVNISALTSQRENLLRSKIDADFDFNDDAEDDDDKNEMLKELSSLSSISEEEVKNRRALLGSLTKAYPQNPDNWILRARLEAHVKNFDQAKKIIQQGCDQCPKDEEIWLENVRLNEHDLKKAKIIVAEGVKYNNKSSGLWLKGMELESEVFNKKRVLRKALEHISDDVAIWTTLTDLEDDVEDKIKFLTKALEIIPQNESLWLKLIDLEPYESAKKTLNLARKTLGNDNVNIWLRALKLEFSENPSSDKIEKIVRKMFKECHEVDRDGWFQYAIQLENEGLTYLTTLVVKELMNNETENYEKWVEDSNSYDQWIYITKEILNQIIIKFPKKTIIWKRLISLYKKHFSQYELYQIFENILEILPKNAIFWLMYSKTLWKNGNMKRAIETLNKSLKFIPDNVEIWSALIKLELISNNFDTVSQIYSKLTEEGINSDRIWYKYVAFLRNQGNISKALEIVDEAIDKYPESWKLYLQKAQILQSQNELSKAREALSIGSKILPENSAIWIMLSEIDIAMDNIMRARSDLDLGLLKKPSDLLWCAKLEQELKIGNKQQIPSILNKALKEFPESSRLWLFNLKFHKNNKKMRKTLYQDALKATNNDVRILIFIGVNFWIDGKFDKAQRWFERALESDEDYGDGWCWYYRFMKEMKVEGEEVDRFLERFKEVEPRHGDVWITVSKKVENLGKDIVELLEEAVQIIDREM